MADCKKILTDFGFNSPEADAILERLSTTDSLDKLGEFVMDKTRYAETKKTQDLISKNKTVEFLASVNESIEGTQKPFKRLWNMMVGKNGLWINATARTEARNGRILKHMGMKNRDLDKFLETDEFVNDFITELYPFDGKQKTKNAEAFKLADIVTKEKKLQVKESNLNGSAMMWRDDHVTQQWHDPFRILDTEKSVWKKQIAGLLDENKTMSHVSENISLDELLDDIYDTVTHRLDEKNVLEAQENAPKTAIERKKLEAKKALKKSFTRNTPLKNLMEVQRVLVFKDSASILKYNKDFGYYNIGKSVFSNMDMMDSHVAVGETLGYGYKGDNQNVVPERELDIIFDKLHVEKRISAFERQKLKSALNQISGESYMVGNPSIAKFVVGFQAFQTVTKLGGQMISSVADLWTGALNLHYQGVKPGTAYLGLMNHIYRKAFDKVSVKERDNFLRMLNVGFDGVFGASGRYIASTPVAGRLSRMQDNFLRINGSLGWTNWMREGFSSMASNNFANQLKKGFTKVDKNFLETIKEYGFTEKDWVKLQEIGSFNEKTFREDGNVDNLFITGDWIRQQKGPEALARKLDKYFVMESRIGVPEATGAERALMFQNFNRGTVPDLVSHLFWQFRSHTMSLAMNTYPRIKKLGLPSLLHFLPALGLGYATLGIKNMLKGKEPPAWDDPQVLADALVQSGIAGIFGDFLAGEYGRYHHNLDEAILGAGYSTFKDFGELFTGLSTGNKDAKDVWKALRYNIPYANLFYAEAGLNYGIHYGVMETLSPGYLKRLENRAETMDQEYLVEPSSIWSTGGAE